MISFFILASTLVPAQGVVEINIQRSHIDEASLELRVEGQVTWPEGMMVDELQLGVFALRAGDMPEHPGAKLSKDPESTSWLESDVVDVRWAKVEVEPGGRFVLTGSAGRSDTTTKIVTVLFNYRLRELSTEASRALRKSEAPADEAALLMWWGLGGHSQRRTPQECPRFLTELDALNPQGNTVVEALWLAIAIGLCSELPPSTLRQKLLPFEEDLGAIRIARLLAPQNEAPLAWWFETAPKTIDDALSSIREQLKLERYPHDGTPKIEVLRDKNADARVRKEPLGEQKTPHILFYLGAMLGAGLLGVAIGRRRR